MSTFEDFYGKQHTGRKLTWNPSLGSVELTARFGKKKHIVMTATYHAMVLLLFNDSDAVPYTELKARTGIPDAELRRSLQSLACGKARLLTKKPASRDVNDADIFYFNDKFTSKMIRIKIQQVAVKENAAEREVCGQLCFGECMSPLLSSSFFFLFSPLLWTHGFFFPTPQETKGKLDEERKHEIEACIVRIMKARKQLQYQILVNEVVQQLQARFRPNVSHVKKRIESLIDREFLERDEKDRYGSRLCVLVSSRHLLLTFSFAPSPLLFL